MNRNDAITSDNTYIDENGVLRLVSNNKAVSKNTLDAWGSGYDGSTITDFASGYGGDISDYLNSLSEAQLQSLASNFQTGSFLGVKRASVSDLLQALYQANKVYGEVGGSPLETDYIDRNKAWADADAYADELFNTQKGVLNNQLQSAADSYNANRSAILSNNVQQNAQLMDTMRSQMSKQRMSALEAGASAGVRIANNINTMLSNQNAATNNALNTNNQLAQMMLQQRNTENSIYDKYLTAQQDKINNRNAMANQNLNRMNDSWEQAQAKYNDSMIKSGVNDNPVAEGFFNWKSSQNKQNSSTGNSGAM